MDATRAGPSKVSTNLTIRTFRTDSATKPPHFHAYYGEYEITVGIRDAVVSGTFPRRALRHILEWRELHEEALLEDWQLACEHRTLKRIPPLE